MQQRSADSYTLPHSAGQLFRILVLEPGEPHLVDQIHGTLTHLRGVYASHVRLEKDILKYGAPWHEKIILKNDAQIGVRLNYKVIIDNHLTGRRRLQARDQPEKS
ncbi:hypothetical protein BJ994_002726 [Arthrobacter pigmenti]|uniref:Uncharacterized protein n=1 Tax=Arthrobacter pigmenti TaxID=271432 RepID=A0A846RQ09_9MICC|nr:hypothetical protein [Arthrobacter pigmenti]